MSNPLGFLKKRVKVAARIQLRIIDISGIGSAASATMGDIIVIARAVTLHAPKTAPKKCDGK